MAPVIYFTPLKYIETKLKKFIMKNKKLYGKMRRYEFED